MYYYSYGASGGVVSPIDDPRPAVDVLKDFMERHHMTAYELAPLIGVTRATVGRWIERKDVPMGLMLKATLTMLEDGRIPWPNRKDSKSPPIGSEPAGSFPLDDE